jgi:hypothetical protein
LRIQQHRKQEYANEALLSEQISKIEAFLTSNLNNSSLFGAFFALEKVALGLKQMQNPDETLKIRLLTASVNAKRIFNANLKEKLQKCKNVHFMHNEKFTNPTINFISKHFPKGENLFLVHRVVPDSYTAQKFPEGESVIESDYSLLDPKDFADKKLIFHSLFDRAAVNWLYKNPSLLSHSYWEIWGGDIYEAPTDEVNTFVRKNIYGIRVENEMRDIVIQKWGANHVFFDGCLTLFPSLNFEKLQHLKSGWGKSNTVVIQVNVSANESTIEMLDILAKFKDENIQVRTIVSYRNTAFAQKIIEKGKDVFGDKFSYLDKMIPPDEYNEYLAQNDILIIYVNRQMGGGNTISSLILGKKVFFKLDTSNNSWYKENGIKIFDADKIKDMTFHEFCEISQETVENNIKNTENALGEESYIKSYNNVFNDKCSALNSEDKQ